MEYVTSPDTGTVHVTENGRRTICGRRDADWWPRGDETMTGIAATCASCKAIARARWRREAPLSEAADRARQAR